MIVIDISSNNEIKLLFGDTSILSYLHFNISQSELYLLLGFWFDNLNERAQFDNYNQSHNHQQQQQQEQNIPGSPQYYKQNKKDKNNSALDNESKNVNTTIVDDDSINNGVDVYDGNVNVDNSSSSSSSGNDESKHDFRVSIDRIKNIIPLSLTLNESSGDDDAGDDDDDDDINQHDNHDGKNKGKDEKDDCNSNVEDYDSDVDNVTDNDGASIKELPHPSLHSYGNKEFIKFLLHRNCTFHILIVFAEVRLECSIDLNHFSRKIPNYDLLVVNHTLDHDSRSEEGGTGIGTDKSSNRKKKTDKNTYYQSSSSSLPIADLSLSGLVTHIEMDYDVIHISMSSGKIELYDIRSLKTPTATTAVAAVIPLSVRVASKYDPTTKFHVYEVPKPGKKMNNIFSFNNFRNNSSSNNNPDNNHNSDENDNEKNYRIYGYSDFQFGFINSNNTSSTTYSSSSSSSSTETSDNDNNNNNKNNHFLSNSMIISLPFQLSCIVSTITNWNIINIGLDVTDINAQNMDLLFLISDYFSCYFRFPEYGHPGVIAYNEYKDLYNVPYGGVDTRLFINQPHLSILKSSSSSLQNSILNSQTILIETNHGIYYRYVLDTNNAIRMNLNIINLALILVKRYRPPNLNRNIRGSSGSGKGVRTLVEFLNISMSYHYISEDNQLDLKLILRGPSVNNVVDNINDAKKDNADNYEADQDDNDNENFKTGKKKLIQENEFIDLNNDRLDLNASIVPYPHSIYPIMGSQSSSHNSSSSSYSSSTCDIVASYEDLHLCIDVYKAFLHINDYTKSNSATTAPSSSAEVPLSTAAVEAAAAVVDDLNIDIEDNIPNNSNSMSFFSIISICKLRIIMVDNVLGLHLPMIKLQLDEFESTVVKREDSNYRVNNNGNNNNVHVRYDLMEKSRRDSFSHELAVLTNHLSRTISYGNNRLSNGNSTISGKNKNTATSGCSGVGNNHNNNNITRDTTTNIIKIRHETLMFSRCQCWADYFNNIRKCWEPLLEKNEVTAMFEKVKYNNICSLLTVYNPNHNIYKCMYRFCIFTYSHLLFKYILIFILCYSHY